MMAGMMPWAPIVAFMVASPLTSPEELFYSAGIFGWPFALTFFGASIVLGLAGGVAAALLDRAGWLRGQARMAAVEPGSPRPSTQASRGCECASPANPIPVATLSVCGCDGTAVPLSMAAPSACGCNRSGTSAAEPARPRVSWQDFLKQTLSTGKQLMKMYLGFALLVFPEWRSRKPGSTLFGGSSYGIPLAATRLPFCCFESIVAMVKALMDGGMGQGAAMAFMISGAGTSVGAIAGALTIARWRVIALVVGVLWVGAIAFGFLYNAIPGLP
jgi:uncharacterized membrane protein YraQ (UPF0718 family)